MSEPEMVSRTGRQTEPELEPRSAPETQGAATPPATPPAMSPNTAPATPPPTTAGTTARQLCDPVLESTGVLHGFAERGAQVPDSTLFVKQVHGVVVVRGEALDRSGAVEADAITSSTAGLPVGIVTADCVPILIAREDGTRVAAVHAGWRGLAAGIIEAGLAAMASPAAALRVAVGPAARGCCYEVDEPVVRALAERHRALLPDVLEASRPGHHRLDLAELAVRVVARAGVAAERIGTAHRLCTICTPGPRFESYRRDGAAAGRLRHFIAPAPGSRLPAPTTRSATRAPGRAARSGLGNEGEG